MVSLNPLTTVTTTFQIVATYGAVLGYIGFMYLGILLFRPDILDVENRVGDMPVTSLRPVYDFIVVGGGSAGAVVANRLSENPAWNVLLLEAGGPEPVLAEIPVMFPSLQKTSIDWQFRTEKSDKFCLSQNGISNWPRGKVIGGCSNLNAMLYVRGNPIDYDQWEKMGNPGWGYRDVLHYFKKLEDIRIPEYENSNFRNKGGYLTVERIRYKSPIVDNLLEASSQIGYKRIDINGGTQVGFDRTQGSLRDGLRCSTAKAYLRPAINRPNLHISLYSRVTRVIINEATKQAEGVEFQKNDAGPLIRIRASKEVILSAGAVQSPQILMLSGIGPADHLTEKGIRPIVDLYGVGRNMQDHIAMGGVTFLFDSPPQTLPVGAGFVLQRILTVNSLIQFEYEKKGPMYDIPFCELMGFVNTKYSNNTNWPDIQFIIGTAGDMDDGGLFFRKDTGLTDEAFNQVFRPNLFHDAVTIAPLLMRPDSAGRITLKDNNPFSAPVINANYFDAPKDIKVLREGAKIAYKLGTAPAMKEVNARFNGIPFPGCEQYEMLSDEFWECQGRHYTLTIYHPSGTCKMGPAWDREAVVDSNLIVRGINNLRVIDASIMPRIVTGNTNIPTIMIGEKGSDLIKEKWLGKFYYNLIAASQKQTNRNSQATSGTYQEEFPSSAPVIPNEYQIQTCVVNYFSKLVSPVFNLFKKMGFSI